MNRWRRLIGFFGIAVALVFFAWLGIGWIDGVPSLVDVFGVPGLRTPAAITVAGLLTAAIAFWEV